MSNSAKYILIPTNLSHQPVKTLRFALDLFKGENCHFCLLNSYQIPQSSRAQIIQEFDNQKEKAREELDEILSALPKFVREENFTFEKKTMVGNIYRAMRRLVADHDVFAIVVGGKSPENTGSIHSKLDLRSVFANSEPVPILAVPEEASFQPLKNIIIDDSLEKVDAYKTFQLIRFFNDRFQSRYSFIPGAGREAEINFGPGKNGVDSLKAFPSLNVSLPVDLTIRNINLRDRLFIPRTNKVPTLYTL